MKSTRHVQAQLVLHSDSLLLKRSVTILTNAANVYTYGGQLSSLVCLKAAVYILGYLTS